MITYPEATGDDNSLPFSHELSINACCPRVRAFRIFCHAVYNSQIC